MRPGIQFGLCMFVVAVCSYALVGQDDSRIKAERQLSKVTAMALDVTARGIVSRTMSDMLHTPRAELLRQRRRMNLNYGGLFLLHELLAAGAGEEEIAAELKAGRTLGQVAKARNLDWKKAAAGVKKLNSRIEDGIYRHFLNEKNTAADTARDEAEQYHADFDWTAADQAVTPEEIVQAQTTYVFWRTQAGKLQLSDKRLGIAKEKAAAFDHSDSTRLNGQIPAPPAGGLPSR